MFLGSTLDGVTHGEEVAGAGASDTFASPTYHGELELGAQSMAVLTDGERFHAFDFTVDEKAFVRLSTLPAPDAYAVVDTVMYLYARRDGGWGRALAKSDDARGTPWSEIARELSPGVYRVLVKGRTLRERGAIVVGFDCPQCLRTSRCVFGDVFGKVRRGLTVKVEEERLIDDPTQLSRVEKLQLVDALHESSHTDVTTPEEALARVDANEVNVLRLWDATNARAFVAFEYGAGDNSYGRIYPLTSVDAAAGIHDGDLVRCSVEPGSLGGDCRRTSDCRGAGVCEGLSPATGRGTCVSSSAPEGVSLPCSAVAPCGAGLVCAGLARGPEGICQPAWMERTFTDWRGTPLESEPVARALDAHGLATVDMDVRIRAILRAPAPGRLAVTLANPVGTRVTVYDGESAGADILLDEPVLGLSGDESVNGTWTLEVTSTPMGSRPPAKQGSLERWSLTITSRYD